MNRRGIVAWTLAGFAIACLIGNEILKAVFGIDQSEDVALFVPVIAGGIAMAVVGALIAGRTGNPLGWLLIAIPSTAGIFEVAGAFSDHGWRLWYAPLAYWLSQWPFFASLILLIAIFYLFPTGRLPSRRWRWPWRAYVGSGVFTLVGFALLPSTQRERGSVVTNPVGLDPLEPILSPLLAVAGATLLLSSFLAFASLWARYRGGETEERQQLRWLFAVAATGAVLFGLLLLSAALLGDESSVGNVILALLVVDVVVGIPVTAAIAIFRYHLYDLNLVVRRTLVVAAMTLAITLVYVAIVVAVPVAIRGAGAEGGFDPLPLVAAAAIAVLFDPLRRWARRLADRLVFGERATPYEVLTAFGDRMGDAYSTDDVLPRMVQVLAQGTGADQARVWLRVGRELREASAWPETPSRSSVPMPPGDELPTLDGNDAFEVRHQGELLGALSLRMPPSEPMDPSKDKLVRDVAAQAGLVLRNVRLIEELRASRQRLVAAQDEERRKLERNLHDGAQQQLVALAVQLKLVRTIVDRDPPKAAELLDATQTAAGEALEDLRDLARGIYPPLLADKGLAVALEGQARKAAVPVRIDTDGVGRYPQEIEAAVYFCTLEALNNVAKYAEASEAVVALAARNGELTAAVTDDGRGFDPTTAGYGTGLQGMVDRLDAIGGTLEVRSAPGEGTTITARVPARAENSA